MTGRRHLFEHVLDSGAAQPLLHDVMPIGAGEQPSEVRGWREASGRLRRVRAVYPNGWVLQFSISKRDTIGRIRATCSIAIRAPRFPA